MRLKNIKTEKDANQYIKETYIPEHNKKYSIKAVSTKDLHVPLFDKKEHRFLWYFAKESARNVHYNNKVYLIKKWEKLYNGYSVTVMLKSALEKLF